MLKMFEDDNTMTYDKVSHLVHYKLGSRTRHVHHVGQSDWLERRQVDFSKQTLGLANLGTLVHLVVHL